MKPPANFLGPAAAVAMLLLAPPAVLASQNDQPREVAAPARLGMRAEIVRGATTAGDAVVVVPDGASYLRAIAHWTPTRRFPVLIDDGDVRTREDIARFVRAYEPKRVLRWKSEEAGALAGTNPQRQGAMERAVLDAWGFGPEQNIADLYGFWRAKEQFAPGVVVSHPADPAWTGAVAFAVFRAQPLAWVLSPRNVNGMLQRQQAEELASEIESACAGLGFAWRELGDQIDAVSLCLNAPVKYNHAEGEVRALTDRIGRLAGDERAEKRWAFASQVFGDEADAAYMAMCGLFLLPEDALLFDGYGTNQPFSRYEMASVVPLLSEIDIASRTYAEPRNSREQWLIGAARALDAGLIFVNSHGMRDEFNLSPGRLRPGDLPILHVPAMVHFIHSWSAVRPGDRSTVGGRWFERGVHAYYGSVNEPYLQAFVQPRLVAGRLRAAYPWAAAVRFDESPIWKLACFGDPLIALGAPLTRGEIPIDMTGAEDLSELVAPAARAGRFAEAFELLSLLGRDEDALRLARALMRERPEEMTPEVASAAMFAVGREGTPSELFDVYVRLDDSRASDPYRLDYLWNLVRLRINAPGEDDRAMIAFLRDHLRPDQRAEDAADLSGAIATLQTPRVALEFLDSIEHANQRDLAVLDEAKRRLSGP